MKRFTLKLLLIIIILFSLGLESCSSQTAGRTRGKSPERSLSGKSRKVKEVKIRQPRVVSKAQKKQEKKEKKLDKDFKNYVADSKKHAFKIQSSEVQARMKQNSKDIAVREKAKKKHTAAATKKASRKYKK